MKVYYHDHTLNTRKKYVIIIAVMPTLDQMQCHCRRCGQDWLKRIPGRPKFCPSCKSPYWDTKAGERPMGRPPKVKVKSTKGKKATK